MISQSIARWGAVGAVIAGVMWALSGTVAFVFAEQYGDSDTTGTLYFYLFEGAHAVAYAAILAALVGFHARQTPAYGKLGTAAFLVALVGAAGGWFSGVLWLVCLNGCNAPVFTTIWNLSLLCWLVGFSLLGMATFRARILSRPSGLLLIAYFPLVGVAVSFDGEGGMMLLFLTLVGLLWLALGYTLWRSTVIPTGKPVLARRA